MDAKSFLDGYMASLSSGKRARQRSANIGNVVAGAGTKIGMARRGGPPVSASPGSKTKEPRYGG
jgi:hypothetical protein